METAILISTLLGPILGALFAWTFANRDARTNAIIRLMTKTFEDAHNNLSWAMEYYKRLLGQRVGMGSPSPVQGPSASDALTERRQLQSRLVADCMALTLLIGEKSDRVKASITNLFAFADRIPEMHKEVSLPERLDRITSDFEPLIGQVYNEMLQIRPTTGSGEV